MNNKNHQRFVKNNIKLSGFFQMKMNNLFFLCSSPSYFYTFYFLLSSKESLLDVLISLAKCQKSFFPLNHTILLCHCCCWILFFVFIFFFLLFFSLSLHSYNCYRQTYLFKVNKKKKKKTYFIFKKNVSFQSSYLYASVLFIFLLKRIKLIIV